MEKSPVLKRPITARQYLVLYRPGRFYLSPGETTAINSLTFLEVLLKVGKTPGPEFFLGFFKGGLNWLSGLQNSSKAAEKGLTDLTKSVTEMSTKLHELEKMREVMNDLGLDNQKLADETARSAAAILLEQQRNTEKILGAIRTVSIEISGLRGHIDSWFDSTMSQLKEMEEIMNETIKGAGDILSKVEELLELQKEVKNGVQWGSIIGIITEFQLRVEYAVQMGLNIRSNPNKQEGLPMQVYDIQELRTWAQDICNLADGLSYQLYGIHRIMIGDTIVGKPLMALFFQLYSKSKGLTADPKVARLFTYMVGLQVQGFAVLNHARQYLNLEYNDREEQFVKQIKEQIRITVECFNSSPYITAWRGLGQVSPDHTLEEKSSMNDPKCFLMVPDSKQVVCGISILGSVLQLEYGTVKPGTLVVENIKSTTAYRSQNKTYREIFTGGIPATHLFGLQSHHAKFINQPTVVEANYAVVGVKFSTPDNCARLEPIVAIWDSEKGETTWDGNYGDTWAVTLKENESLNFEAPKEFGLGVTLKEETYGMLRGVQLVYKESSQAFFVSYLSTSAEFETWLPLELAMTPSVYTPTAIPQDHRNAPEAA